MESFDNDDRHVLAAAIKTNADLIIINNIKDFPEDYLQTFSLKEKTADKFLSDIIDRNQEQALTASKEMVLKKIQNKTSSRFYIYFEKQGLRILQITSIHYYNYHKKINWSQLVNLRIQVFQGRLNKHHTICLCISQNINYPTFPKQDAFYQLPM